jgi:hypothetical protein
MASLPGYLSLKLLFTLGLIGVGAGLLERLMRPGQDGRKPFAFVFLPFLIIVCAGVASLVFGQPMAWGRMIFGMHWAACLLCIRDRDLFLWGIRCTQVVLPGESKRRSQLVMAESPNSDRIAFAQSCFGNRTAHVPSGEKPRKFTTSE